MRKIINKIKKFFYTKDGAEQNEINKQLITIVVSIMITVVSVIGVTFSAFVWSDNSVKNQNLVVGNIELNISSNSSSLGSGLDYPVALADESSLTPYTFTITNTGTLSSTYRLKIVSDEAYTNTIDTQYVYISLDGARTINRTPLSSYETLPIDAGILAPSEIKTYDLRMWIVENAPNSVIGQQWHGKILLESSQTNLVADVEASNLAVISDSDVENDSNITSFILENPDNITKYFDISLSDVVIDEEIKNNNFKWRLLDGEIILNEGNFNDVGNNKLLQRNIEIGASSSKEYKLLIWYSDSSTDLIDKGMSAKVISQSYDEKVYFAPSEKPVLTNTINGNSIQNLKIYGNSVQNEVSNILPSEYQEVEYIESTGTQYLEIDYIASNITSSKGTFQLTDTSAGAMLFGSRTAATSNSYTFNWGGNSKPYKYYNVFYMATADGAGITTKAIDLEKHTFKKLGIDLYIDNVLINSRTDMASKVFNTPGKMIVFGSNTSGTIGLHPKAKLYNLQFYDNDDLKVDLIPCYRKSDNVIGMYDLVTDVFYTNKGTGDFKKGNDIKDNSVGDYVNGNYQIPITVSGLNLSNFTSAIDNDILVDNGDNTYNLVYSNKGRFTSKYNVNIPANTTFTISLEILESNISHNYIFNVEYKLADGTVKYSNFSKSAKSKTHTFTSDVKQIRFYQQGTGEVGSYTKFKNLMINLGNNASSYEPYVEPVTHTINLSEPLRSNGSTRDYIDFELGKVIRWIASDGSILSNPKEENITLPVIKTMEGVTTISTNTIVKPLISGSY